MKAWYCLVLFVVLRVLMLAAESGLRDYNYVDVLPYYEGFSVNSDGDGWSQESYIVKNPPVPLGYDTWSVTYSNNANGNFPEFSCDLYGGVHDDTEAILFTPMIYAGDQSVLHFQFKYNLYNRMVGGPFKGEKSSQGLIYFGMSDGGYFESEWSVGVDIMYQTSGTAEVSIPAEYFISYMDSNGYVRFAIIAYASSGTWTQVSIDNFKVYYDNSLIEETTVTGGQGYVVLGDITNLTNYQSINQSVDFALNSQTETNVLVSATYAPSYAMPVNPGLTYLFSGANFSQANIIINHNLGFAPDRVGIRRRGGGSWLYAVPGALSDANVSYLTIPNLGKADDDLIICFPANEGGTLPVELSSFTGMMSAGNNVALNWTVQSETGIMGYYVLRGETSELNQAGQISPLIPAVNSSTSHSYTHTDTEVFNHTQYFYWLDCREYDGTIRHYGPIMVQVNFDGEVPPPASLQTKLGAPYPNPFNPSVSIPFSLQDPSSVRLEVFNHKGQLVRLFFGSFPAGKDNTWVWNGISDDGISQSSGVYLIRMQAGSYMEMRKLILQK